MGNHTTTLRYVIERLVNPGAWCEVYFHAGPNVTEKPFTNLCGYADDILEYVYGNTNSMNAYIVNMDPSERNIYFKFSDRFEISYVINVEIV